MKNGNVFDQYDVSNIFSLMNTNFITHIYTIEVSLVISKKEKRNYLTLVPLE